jgi:adenylate cyclase
VPSRATFHIELHADSATEAERLRPDDKLCAIHVERCAHYLNEPPPEDWDGVWVMKEK